MDVISWLALAGAVACILYLIWVAFRGDPARIEEDDSRAFFDLHGRWPDEPEEAAVPRPGGYADVDRLRERE